jgi:two-component system phosphate regulon sensor histidine kinase PhoR
MGLKKIRRTFSLTYTIIIYFTVATVISISILLYFILITIDQYYLQSNINNLSKSILVIEDTLEEKPLNIERLFLISEILDLQISIITLYGKIEFDTHADNITILINQSQFEEIQQVIEEGVGYSRRRSNNFDHNRLFYAIRSDARIIRISKSMTDINQTLYNISQATILSGTVLLAFLVVINFIISKRITRPILETINFAEHFSRKDFSKRILNYSTNDIGILQRSLNKLADSLETHVHDLIFEQNKMNSTINHIRDSIAVIGMDNKVILSNHSFSELFNYKETEGHSYFEVIRSSKINNAIEQTLTTNEEYTFEETLMDKLTYEISLTPIKGAINFRGILLLLHDITHKKKIDIMKTDLVGNLSHELKTPIAILKGYLETIELHLDNKDMCLEMIDKSYNNIERLHSIITDMLKLNMLETETSFDEEPVLPAMIIETCINILLPKIRTKNIKISLDLHDQSQSIRGNKFLAEQIFFNIITNAVNYNKQGGEIRFRSYYKDDRKFHKNYIVYEIIDTGIGIPQDKLSRIFERFFRVDKGRSRITGGTGLGLAIVKHSAEILSWYIDVTSQQDVGTTFLINIPYHS